MHPIKKDHTETDQGRHLLGHYLLSDPGQGISDKDPSCQIHFIFNVQECDEIIVTKELCQYGSTFS